METYTDGQEEKLIRRELSPYGGREKALRRQKEEERRGWEEDSH